MVKLKSDLCRCQSCDKHGYTSVNNQIERPLVTFQRARPGHRTTLYSRPLSTHTHTHTHFRDVLRSHCRHVLRSHCRHVLRPHCRHVLRPHHTGTASATKTNGRCTHMEGQIEELPTKCRHQKELKQTRTFHEFIHRQI